MRVYRRARVAIESIAATALGACIAGACRLHESRYALLDSYEALRGDDGHRDCGLR